MDAPRLVPVGKIVRPHGVRGAVKVYPYGETLMDERGGEKFVLRPAGGKPVELTLTSAKPQGKLLVVKFEEIASMDEAERVAGEELLIPEDRLPPTEEGEYYHFELIGLAVETKEGRALGTVRGVMEAGGNDIFVVESPEGKEILIPAVEEIICEVDLAQGKVVVDPPEGLMD